MTNKGLLPYVEKLVGAYEQSLKEGEFYSSFPTIKVNYATSLLALVFEKIRNAIEYKEDHLLRRNAIERILRRRFSPRLSGRDIAFPLLRELIRARYLKNNSVPLERVEAVGAVIEKYKKLFERALPRYAKKEAKSLFRWLLSVASSEIENVLVSDRAREAWVELMYRFMRENLKSGNGEVGEETKKFQIYIGVHRALVKSDEAILRFRLFLYYFPKWAVADAGTIEEAVERLGAVKRKIEEHLGNSFGLRLFYFLKKHTAPFTIIKELVEENPSAALERFRDALRLEECVKRICRKKYEETGVKVRRKVTRAIVYIFLTKMLLALLLEFPADKLLYQRLLWGPLLINVLFPPFLMFLMAATIHVPGEENTRILLLRIRSILFGEPFLQKGDHFLTFFWYPAKRSRFLIKAFRALYFLAFVVSFGLIVFVLRFLNFTPVSIAIFILFLCLVTLFGYAIRQSAQELVTLGKRENVLTPFGDFLLLPILRVGHWLSSEWSKINFFTFLFDFIIEAPLKSFIEIAEEWIIFVKEKKEELV